MGNHLMSAYPGQQGEDMILNGGVMMGGVGEMVYATDGGYMQQQQQQPVVSEWGRGGEKGVGPMMGIYPIVMQLMIFDPSTLRLGAMV